MLVVAIGTGSDLSLLLKDRFLYLYLLFVIAGTSIMYVLNIILLKLEGKL